MKIVVVISTIVHGQKSDQLQNKEANQNFLLKGHKSSENVKSFKKGNKMPEKECLPARSARNKIELSKNASRRMNGFTGLMFRPKTLTNLPSEASNKKENEKKENVKQVPVTKNFSRKIAHCPDLTKTIRFKGGWLFYLS